MNRDELSFAATPAVGHDGLTGTYGRACVGPTRANATSLETSTLAPSGDDAASASAFVNPHLRATTRLATDRFSPRQGSMR